jgi:prepilin-type N-terminal cleavage/methylation domain-containing protein
MRRRRAFTMLELLITIAIMAILAALLLAALRAVREQARLTNCQSNIREIIKGAVNWAGRQTGYLRNTLPGGPPLTSPYNYDTSITGQTTLYDGTAPVGLQVRSHGFVYQAKDIQNEEVFYCPDQVSSYFSNSPTSGFLFADSTSRWRPGNIVRSSYAYRTSLQSKPGTTEFRVFNLERDGTREPILADAFTESPIAGDQRFAHNNAKYCVGFGDGRTVVFEDDLREIERLALPEPSSAAEFLPFEYPESNPAPGPWTRFKRV